MINDIYSPEKPKHSCQDSIILTFFMVAEYAVIDIFWPVFASAIEILENYCKQFVQYSLTGIQSSVQISSSHIFPCSRCILIWILIEGPSSKIIEFKYLLNIALDDTHNVHVLDITAILSEVGVVEVSGVDNVASIFAEYLR